MILIIDCDPFSLIKLIKKSLPNAKIVFEKIRIQKIGDLTPPYISIYKSQSKMFFSTLSQLNKLKCICKDAQEKLIKESEERVYIYSKDGKNLTIVIPKSLKSLLSNTLKEWCRVEYYINDIREGLVKREVFYYKEYAKDNSYIVRTPKFIYSKLISLLEDKGIPYRIGEGVLKLANNIDVKKEPVLYDYQEEAYNAWKNNNYWGTVVIPTGGGKTFLGLAAIARIKKPTIILVPNLWLLYQWIDRISSILGVPKRDIGVLGGGEKRISDITISTYQSAHKNIEQFSDIFHVAIFDEAHHVPASTFKKVALYLASPYRMALSATPTRSDKNEVLLFNLAGEVVYKVSYPELVKKGFVAPLVVRKIFVKLPKELEKEYKKVQARLRVAYDEISRKQIINKLIELSRDNPKKIPVIMEIVKKHKDEKIFIFAGSIDFAKRILNELKHVSKVALLTSETRKSEEKRIIRNFVNGLLNILILVKKGEEGVDVGDASVAIIAGGTKQKRETIQRIGRILRGGAEKLAWVYEIVTTGTIEERLSKGRKIEALIKGLEGIIKSQYGIEPYKVINWENN